MPESRLSTIPTRCEAPTSVFYSYQRVPEGRLPEGYLPVAPELVFEVRLPGDRWRDVLGKVSEYLGAGVKVIVVVDQQTESATVYSEDEAPKIVRGADELTFPYILPGFRVAVARLFE